MRSPSPRDVPYNLTKIIPGDRNESDTEALRVLKNKVCKIGSIKFMY